MSSTVQRMCGWAGFAWMIVFTIGFCVVAGFIPPPSPSSDAQTIAAIFDQDRTRIRAGLVVAGMASGLFAAYTAGLSMQLRKIEGRRSGLAYLNLALGSVLVLELIFPMMAWQAATFRAERAPEMVQAINDFAWLAFVGVTATTVLQPLTVAAAILGDRGAAPVFPRWVAYLNIWAALLLAPGGFIVFFKGGPLAWNGLFALYLPLLAFGIWVTVMSILLIRTARTGPTTPDAPGAHPAVERGSPDEPDVEAIMAELAQLRRELAEVTDNRP